MTTPLIKTSQFTTRNGTPYTVKSYMRPGFHAAVNVGDIESFTIEADNLMTFYPNEVREIAAALVELADAVEETVNIDDIVERAGIRADERFQLLREAEADVQRLLGIVNDLTRRIEKLEASA